MEPCGFARLRGVNSIHRPKHANRENKRLDAQADRLNGFSVESEAHEAWLCLRREALRHHRGLTTAGAGTLLGAVLRRDDGAGG